MSEYTERCATVLKEAIDGKEDETGNTEIFPNAWLPSYAAMYRVSANKIVTATNYHLPRYLYALQPNLHSLSRIPPRPFNIRKLFFQQRINYIENSSPYIAEAERNFATKLIDAKYNVIQPHDSEARKFVFDIDAIGDQKQEIYNGYS